MMSQSSVATRNRGTTVVSVNARGTIHENDQWVVR
jgi:hypothetical protein